MTLRNHTMRDLLSKLDSIISEEPIKPTVKDPELQAKRKALQDLQMDPTAHKDPEIKRAIAIKKAELDKEAKEKGVGEAFEIDRQDLKVAHDKGYSDASNGIDKNPFDYGTPAFKSYREGQLAYKRHFGESAFQVGDEFGISFNEDFEISSTIVGIVEDGIVIELDDRAFDFLTNEGWSFEDTKLDESHFNPVTEEDSEEVKVKIDGETYYVKNSDQGPVIIGEDISGYWTSGEAEGSLDFEASLKGDIKYATVKLYGSNSGGSEDADEWAVKDHVYMLIDEIKKQYGETWEEIKDEAEGGMSVEKEEFTSEAEYQGRKVPLGKPMKGDVKKSKVYVKKPNGKVVKVNFGDKKMRIKKSNPTRRKSFRARHNCSNPGPRWKARYWSCRAW